MKKIGNKGFTLIELLVVIAIIGILSSVVLASLNTAREKSRDAKRISDVAQLQLALELYFDDDGKYPTTALGLADLVTKGYIASVPTPPNGATQTTYGYQEVTGLTSYCLGADLENNSHTAIKTDCTLAGYDHTVQP